MLSRIDKWTGRVEQPRQGLTQLRRLEPGGKVAFDVADGAFEHIEPIAQRIELRACDNELMLTEPELVGAVTRFVVTLPATLPAVLTGSSLRCRGRQRAPAPPARRTCARARSSLRHCDER